MPNLSLNIYFPKNSFSRKSICIILCLLAIIAACQVFAGCGLFYYDTSGADGSNASTFTKNSNNADNTNNSGNSNNTNNSNNAGNTDGAYGSSGMNDSGSAEDSNQSSASEQDLQRGWPSDIHTVNRVI